MSAPTPSGDMRLLIVVLQNTQGDRVSARLQELGAHVTTVSSTGGFLRRRSVTLLAGLPADTIQAALAAVRELCITPPDAELHTATVFVLRAEQFAAF